MDESWKVEEKKMMTFSEFLLRLSEQMLLYDPRNMKYAGDEKFRVSTQTHKKRRRSKDLSEEIFPDTGVTHANLTAATSLPRFCKTIDGIQLHFSAIKHMTNPKKM